MFARSAAASASKQIPALGPDRAQHQYRSTRAIGQQSTPRGRDPLPGFAGTIRVTLGLIQPHNRPRAHRCQLREHSLGPGRIKRVPKLPSTCRPQHVQGLPSSPSLAGGGAADQHRHAAPARQLLDNHFTQPPVMSARSARRSPAGAGPEPGRASGSGRRPGYPSAGAAPRGLGRPAAVRGDDRDRQARGMCDGRFPARRLCAVTASAVRNARPDGQIADDDIHRFARQ